MPTLNHLDIVHTLPISSFHVEVEILYRFKIFSHSVLELCFLCETVLLKSIDQSIQYKINTPVTYQLVVVLPSELSHWQIYYCQSMGMDSSFASLFILTECLGWVLLRETRKKTENFRWKYKLTEIHDEYFISFASVSAHQ